MNVVFGLLALMVVASAAAAVSFRNLIHCALALSVCFAGLAAVYLSLNAQFVGFAQILIYVGAVAILIVFAILLTRRDVAERETGGIANRFLGLAIALAVLMLIGGIVYSSHALVREMPPPPSASVRSIGDELMTHWVLPLEVLGLLLTTALIGAVVIAMKERRTQ